MSEPIYLLPYYPPVKKTKLSLRQYKYKLNRLKGMNQYNAARAAGYSETTSRNKSGRIENIVKSTLYDLLERKGVTDQTLADHLAKGLKAKKVVSVETDERNAQGQKVYRNVTVPDWPARHKYVNTILELKGHKKESALETGGVDNSVQILIIQEHHGDNGKLRDSEARNDHQTIDVGAEAISRISKPSP